MKILEEFITPTQRELFSNLCAMYKGRTNICEKGYILVEGEAPIMLVAHLDTVHKEPVKNICKTENGNILMSPQGIGGDDRCGVYALATVYEKSPVKPWLLFTCDEEIGGVGAKVFCTKYQKDKLPEGLDKLKMLVEIDRRGKTDAVYYDCDNAEFKEYITGKGFKTQWGSFSDISYIAPELGVAAVNLSSGYYNAHTLHEYINRKQLNATVEKVVEIVADSVKSETPRYEYVEARRNSRSDYGYSGRYGSGAKGTKAESDLILLGDDPDFKDIPEDILGEYIMLSDFYLPGELDALRIEYGDSVIPRLFESEFGASYERYMEGY